MPARAHKPIKLDLKDLKILEVVQREGRVSKKVLAQSVGLTLTPCFQRLQRLVRHGFIRAYRGIVDIKRFGSFLWVHVPVTLARHRESDFVRFEAAIEQVPEVFQCDAVGGGIDYILTLIVRDINHYQRIIDALLEREVGMATYATYIVTKRIKEGVALPLDVLIAEPAATAVSQGRARRPPRKVRPA